MNVKVVTPGPWQNGLKKILEEKYRASSLKEAVSKVIASKHKASVPKGSS
jgi:hypothetical protein